MTLPLSEGIDELHLLMIKSSTAFHNSLIKRKYIYQSSIIFERGYLFRRKLWLAWMRIRMKRKEMMVIKAYKSNLALTQSGPH